MSALGQRTLRRLFSDTNKWPSHSLPLITTRSAGYAWPIGPKPELRPIDREARSQLYNTILYLLRSSAARDYGLGTRHDGFLSVRKLLNYPLFRSLDMVQLQELVDNDSKHRFQLLFDPSKGDEAWWLRARLWDEKHISMHPCRLDRGIRLVVYQTTLEEWNSHISRTGISRLNQEYIQLERKIPTKSYVDTLKDESQVFIFLDIRECILAGFRFYFRVKTSSHVSESTPVVAQGNDLGVIPPKFFVRVQMVEAKKKLLWGSDNTVLSKAWPSEPQDFDEHGRRKTLLPLLPKNLHGFVDLYAINDENRRVHPETIREAMEVAEMP